VKKSDTSLKEFLDHKVDEYERQDFISLDPVSIPHQFSRPGDIEIAGFFAAIFSWGNRTTIIAKSRELMERMDNDPHTFITSHKESDLKSLLGFKHRTFNDTDLLYFIHFLRHHYRTNKSLESAFTGEIMAISVTGVQQKQTKNQATVLTGALVERALTHFEKYFFSLPDHPERTHKHISTPAKNSACKRLNMYLRWMVRNSKKGVDFGLWKSIQPKDLICPTDVHVLRIARKLQLIERQQNDWTTALELTTYLRSLDKNDPVKYDFALFGLGVMEKF
jgi:uncharacterized protein (TIGR02757 family)